jgi:hypothetical protein
MVESFRNLMSRCRRRYALIRVYVQLWSGALSIFNRSTLLVDKSNGIDNSKSENPPGKKDLRKRRQVV